MGADKKPIQLYSNQPNKGENMEAQQEQTNTPAATIKPKLKTKKRLKAKSGKTAKQKLRTGTKKSKITGPSVAFNVSIPAKLLPKVDKASRLFAKKNNLSKPSRSAFVRELLLKSVR